MIGPIARSYQVVGTHSALQSAVLLNPEGREPREAAIWRCRHGFGVPLSAAVTRPRRNISTQLVAAADSNIIGTGTEPSTAAGAKPGTVLRRAARSGRLAVTGSRPRPWSETPASAQPLNHRRKIYPGFGVFRLVDSARPAPTTAGFVDRRDLSLVTAPPSKLSPGNDPAPGDELGMPELCGERSPYRYAGDHRRHLLI